MRRARASRFEIVRRIDWRVDDDGTVLVLDPRDGRHVRFAAPTAALLEAVEKASAVTDLVAEEHDEKRRASREARLRRFVFGLCRMGYLDIPVPMPARFLDRYEPVARLGVGGFGVAWRCRDAGGTGQVVLKQAWDFLYPIETANAALAREAENLGRLDHPGIARRLDEFDDDGRRCVVRPFVEGMPLDHRDAPPVTPSPARKQAFAARLAEVTRHVHERRMLVLDHAPGNWLCSTQEGLPLLLDVGHCHLAPEGELRFAGPIGTPGFIPPETERDHVATRRSDVWGLGRLYAFALTRAMPRKGRTSLAHFSDGLEPEDAALVQRLCAEDPAERPASADDALRLMLGR